MAIAVFLAFQYLGVTASQNKKTTTKEDCGETAWVLT